MLKIQRIFEKGFTNAFFSDIIIKLSFYP